MGQAAACKATVCDHVLASCSSRPVFSCCKEVAQVADKTEFELAGTCGSCPPSSPTCVQDCCAQSNDGSFFISPGDKVQAVYTDASPADYIKMTRIVPSVGVVSLTSNNIEHPTHIVIGERIQISLYDVDLPDDASPSILLQSTRALVEGNRILCEPSVCILLTFDIGPCNIMLIAECRRLGDS